MHNGPLKRVFKNYCKFALGQGRVYGQDGVPHMNAQQFHRLCQDGGFTESEGACLLSAALCLQLPILNAQQFSCEVCQDRGFTESDGVRGCMCWQASACVQLHACLQAPQQALTGVAINVIPTHPLPPPLSRHAYNMRISSSGGGACAQADSCRSWPWT